MTERSALHSGFRKKITVATVCALPLIAASPGSAQTDDDSMEEIVVTGSRIVRRDLVAQSPIATIESQDLQLAAQPTLEETLNQMPQFVPNLGRASNNPGNGSAQLDLRGMGAGRTLVLLDGRRFAPSSQGNAVDINNIPQALVDRVEVITGGASTVYGSDALAGVVNFITKKDFRGVSIDARYGTTQDGDADFASLDLAFGTELAGGDGHLTLFAGAYDRDELFAGDRVATTPVISENLSTGELFEGGSAAIPGGVVFFPTVDFGNGEEWTTFNPDGSVRPFVEPDDRYNYQPANYLQLPMERFSAGVMFDYAFGNGTELYAEALYVNNKVSQELAPPPLFEFLFVNVDNPVLTPETQQFFADNYTIEPGLAGFFGGRRILETGSRHIDNERDYWRGVLGFKHYFGESWALNGWVTYTSAEEEEILFNDVSRSRVLQGLLVDPATGQCFDPSGGCAPVDLFGEGRLSVEGADFVRIDPMVNTTDRVQRLASLYLAGSPVENWAGAIDVAFGAEWRSDQVDFEADDYLFTGDALGFFGSAPITGTESVTEGYFEALIPLLSQKPAAEFVELELGARYSDYENAGGAWTYKAGGHWQFNESLRFRTMWQKSVRAPNNEELFQEQYSDFGPYVTDPTSDPCSASQDPAGNGLTDACIATGLPADQIGVFEATVGLPVDFFYGGNPNLVPEDGETFTAGFVITPTAIPNWSFTVDYYDIEITNEIGSVYVEDVCFDTANTGNIFCDAIRRGADGNITEIDDIAQNRGLLATRGIDTQVRYATDLPDSWSLLSGGATFSIDFNWTHMLEVLGQQNISSTVIDCTGTFDSPCAGVLGTAVENRTFTNFNYTTGSLGITLSSRWIEGTANHDAIKHEFIGGEPANVAIESIGSRHYLNLFLGYEFTNNVAASLTVANLTGTEAPLIAGINNNTDYLLYDVFGRSYSLALNLQFGGN